jgi:hypothetical protein
MEPDWSRLGVTDEGLVDAAIKIARKNGGGPQEFVAGPSAFFAIAKAAGIPRKEAQRIWDEAEKGDE